MKLLYDKISHRSSKMITNTYSSSFSMGIKFLAKRFHSPIYAIYGFVRLADEIVDSFHNFDKRKLLADFKLDTYKAIDQKISLNPILNSFQEVVNKYQIDEWTIETFLKSMEMDLDKSTYNQTDYEAYILGSAEVVGLMCLSVFTEGNKVQYEVLKPYAMKLGSAFQKINFLRDFKSDTTALGRLYFPQLRTKSFDSCTKKEIEADIIKDFKIGLEGIKMLPKDARFGVYMAYIYYSRLLAKIMDMPIEVIMEKRVRISDKRKYAIFFGSYFRHSFNLL